MSLVSKEKFITTEFSIQPTEKLNYTNLNKAYYRLKDELDLVDGYVQFVYYGESANIKEWVSLDSTKIYEKDIACISSLRKKDIAFYMDYPPTTAFLDYEMQEKDSMRKRETLHKIIEEENEKIKKNGKVYVSIGAMSGLFFILLLV